MFVYDLPRGRAGTVWGRMTWFMTSNNEKDEVPFELNYAALLYPKFLFVEVYEYCMCE